MAKSHSSLTDKTFKGLFWMFSGKGSQAILQFVVMIVLARLLSPADFGIVNAAMVVITFTTVFSMIGIGPALIQRPRLNESHIRTGFTVTIVLSLIFAMLLFIGSYKIASFFYMDKLEIVLKVMSVIFLLKGLSTVAESLVQRKLRFRLFASIEVISYAIYGIIGIICAIIGVGYWSLVYAQIGQNLVKTLFLITLEKHNMRLQFNWGAFKELLMFGGGFTIARLSNQFAQQADNLVVGRWLSSNALGLYGRAYQLMVMPANLFGQVMDKVLFPAMARVQKKEEQLTKSYRIGITAISTITIPVGIFICLLSNEIVALLFGDKWLKLVPTLQVLSLGLVFRTGYKISDSLARATGAVYKRAWRQIIYALAVFLGAWIGQHWGLVGVGIGVLCAIILNYCLMTHLSMQYINLSIKEIIRTHIPGIFLGAIAVISILLINWLSNVIYLNSLLIVFLSGLLFLVFIFSLAKINVEKVFGSDVAWIKNQILKMIKSKFKKETRV